MSNELMYRWDFLPESDEQLPPLAKAPPVLMDPWQQDEANRVLDTGDLAAVKAFARRHGGGVAGCDPKFLDQLQKAAADSDLADGERGWLAKLFSKARNS
jgi:hypothetical protein